MAIQTFRLMLISSLLLGRALFVSGQNLPEPAMVIPLYEGIAPGSESWDWSENLLVTESGMPIVRNVVNPVLLYYPADPDKAVGTAMIVAPGGGFRNLMMSYEGVDIAKRLNKMGVDAFVLKYRLIHNEDRDKQKGQDIRKMAGADGQQSVRLIRARAREFGIIANRIGMMGFSAGGHVTLAAVMGPADARPDFAAPVYAATGLNWGQGIQVPNQAPPLFIATAADDQIIPWERSMELFKAWRDAGIPAELHIFQTGAHGFVNKGGGADHFMDRLEEWMQVNGWLLAPAHGQRIDTHIHLYDTDREGSSVFLDPVKHQKIYYPHYAQTFKDTANPAGIDYAVVVEASKRRVDNFWLIQHVDTSDAMLAFIANLDPRDPYFVADLDSLSTYKKFRGIRIRPASPIQLGDQSIMDSFGHLAGRNLVLELGGGGVDPKTISAIARRYPGMNIIMNHMAGGRMKEGQIKPSDWLERLKEFAAEPNVYCKISMLYALSGKNPAPIDAAYYKPFIDPVVDAFGPDRVIFGSNWTLSDMLGTYGDMITMYDDYLATRKDLSPEKLYFENVLKAYGIPFSSIIDKN